MFGETRHIPNIKWKSLTKFESNYIVSNRFSSSKDSINELYFSSNITVQKIPNIYLALVETQFIYMYIDIFIKFDEFNNNNH